MSRPIDVESVVGVTKDRKAEPVVLLTTARPETALPPAGARVVAAALLEAADEAEEHARHAQFMLDENPELSSFNPPAGVDRVPVDHRQSHDAPKNWGTQLNSTNTLK